MVIDIVIWDHTGLQNIVASPVSPRGAHALAEYIIREQGIKEDPDKVLACVPVHVVMEEFLANVPASIVIAFYRASDGQFIDVRSLSKNQLQ